MDENKGNPAQMAVNVNVNVSVLTFDTAFVSSRNAKPGNPASSCSQAALALNALFTANSESHAEDKRLNGIAPKTVEA